MVVDTVFNEIPDLSAICRWVITNWFSLFRFSIIQKANLFFWFPIRSMLLTMDSNHTL